MKQKEPIQIGLEGFSIVLLPSAGGKIASIRLDDRELLQSPLVGSMERSRTMLFDESDASGWDECLPSVAECDLPTAAGPVRIPDHGDLWRVPWEIIKAASSACTMRARCFSLPLQLTRTVAVSPIGAGFRMRLDYELCNTGPDSAPWAWSAHPLFAVEEGDRILLPGSIAAVRLDGSCGERLGRSGAVLNWPIAKTSAGLHADLSIAHAMTSGLGDKLFAGPLREDENWCALERIATGLRIQVSFDPSATPFLGLWLCYGGWPARPGRKQMCVALEPSTAAADSLASAGQWPRKLESGASCSWWMEAEFRRI